MVRNDVVFMLQETETLKSIKKGGKKLDLNFRSEVSGVRQGRTVSWSQ